MNYDRPPILLIGLVTLLAVLLAASNFLVGEMQRKQVILECFQHAPPEHVAACRAIPGGDPLFRKSTT